MIDHGFTPLKAKMEPLRDSNVKIHPAQTFCEEQENREGDIIHQEYV